MSIPLSGAQRAYLDHYMNKVSRSFALVAPEVDTPLNDYLAAAYLICRVVDNIEDAEQTFAWRQKRFQEFTALLEDPRRAAAVLSVWDGVSWPGLGDDEVSMMTSRDGETLWQIYSRIPPSYRASIHRWAAEMAVGMERSGDPHTDDFFMTCGAVRLPRTAADYDQYCFYVAGTVGRMITELAITFYGIEGPPVTRLLNGSDACGRALQKTNIVKDFARDLQRGVCFLPETWLREVDYQPLALDSAPAAWKSKVVLDVLAELEDSVSYVQALPQSAVGYRRAGLLMMLPAYETILLAGQRLPQLFTAQHNFKISRKTMARCVLASRRLAPDNAAIGAYAARMSARVRQTVQQSTAADSGPAFAAGLGNG